jgi:CHASE1-domain containing sensor protein
MQNNNQLAIIAIMSALALLGVVIVLAITTLSTMQEAEARGCPLGTPAPNASKGRCFQG